MELLKIYTVLTVDGDEKLVYLNENEYYELRGNVLIDKEVLDLNTLMPYSETFFDTKKRKSKSKVIQRYDMDRAQKIELKRLCYVDIVKSYNSSKVLGSVKQHVLCATLRNNNFYAIREGFVYEGYSDESDQKLCAYNISPIEKQFSEDEILSKRKIIKMDYNKEL